MSAQNSITPKPVLFLKTKLPTEALHDPIQLDKLPEVEKQILKCKKQWLATPYAERLANIISQIIEDRKGEPISNAICLAVSGLNPGIEVPQFVIFSQIVAQLATANPALTSNILVQDPKIQPCWMEMVENHGCQVVKTPAAFKEVGKNSFVFCAWPTVINILRGLKGQPVDELALFVGNDIRWWVDPKYKPQCTRDEDYDHLASIATGMLDERFCNHKSFPCERPDRSIEGDPLSLWMLEMMQMWWRPVRTEPQKAQDRALADWMTACKHGSQCNWIDFLRVYHSSFDGLKQKVKDRVVFSFVARRFFFEEEKTSFAEHYLSYQEGRLDNWQKAIDVLVDEYPKDFKTRNECAFIKYLQQNSLTTGPSPRARPGPQS